MWGAKASYTVQQFTHFGWSVYASKSAKHALQTTTTSAGSAGASSGAATGGSHWHAGGRVLYSLTNSASSSTSQQNSQDDDQDRKRPGHRRFKSSLAVNGSQNELRNGRAEGSGRTIEALSLQSSTLQKHFKRAFSSAAPSAPNTPVTKAGELPSVSSRPRRHSTSAIETSRASSPFTHRPQTPTLYESEAGDRQILQSLHQELKKLLTLSPGAVRSDVRQILRVYQSQPALSLEVHTLAFEALLHIRQAGSPLDEAFAFFDEMPTRDMPWEADTIRKAIQALCGRAREVAAHVAFLEATPGARRPDWIAYRESWSDSIFPDAQDRADLVSLRREGPFQRALELYLIHWRHLDTASADMLLAECALQQVVAPEIRFDQIAARILDCLKQSRSATPSAQTFLHLIQLHRARKDREAALACFEDFKAAKATGALTMKQPIEVLLNQHVNRPLDHGNSEQLIHAGIIGVLFDADEPVEGLGWLQQVLDVGIVAGPAILSEVVSGLARVGDVDAARRWLQRAVLADQPDENLYLTLANSLLEALIVSPIKIQELNAFLIEISSTAAKHAFRFEAHHWWPAVLNANLAALEQTTDKERRKAILSQVADIHTLEAHAATSEVSPSTSIRLARALAREGMFGSAVSLYDELVGRVWSSLTPAAGPVLEPQVAAAHREYLREGAFSVIGASKDGMEQVEPADALTLGDALKVCRALWAIELRPAGALAQITATKYIEMKMKGELPTLASAEWALLVDACAMALISPTSEPQHIRVFDNLVSDALQAGAHIESSPMSAWTASTICSVLPPDFAGPLLGRLMHREPVVASPMTVMSESGVADLTRLHSPTLSSWTPPSPALTSPPDAYLASPKIQEAQATRPTYDDDLSLHLLNAAPKQRDSALFATEQAFSEGRVPHPQALAKLIDLLASDPGRSAKALRRQQVEKIYMAAYNSLPLLSDDPRDPARLTAWSTIEDSMLMAQAHFGELDNVAMHRDRLLAAGCVPSADAYATMILNMRDTTDDATVAVETYHEARRLGVVPNAFLYNTLISRLSRARRATDALMYFHEMRQMGVEPTSVTYGSVINACCKTGDEAQARQLFEDMVNSPRYIPRHPPYNTMIQFFQSKGDRISALEYFDRLVRAKIPLTDHTYRLLIDVYGAIDPVDPASARDVFRMLAKDHHVAVQGMHWAALITMYGTRLRDVNSAIKVFESIDTHRSAPASPSPQPDPLVYEALFHALWTCERRDLVERYRAKMEADGVPMTAYTANALIKGYGSAGDIGAARAVFMSLVDPQTGVAGHSAHHHNPRMHPEPSRSRMLPVDHVYREPSTYEALIAAEVQAGEHIRAQALYESAVKRAFPFAVLDKLARALNG